jgi:hypothetical protein
MAKLPDSIAAAVQELTAAVRHEVLEGDLRPRGKALMIPVFIDQDLQIVHVTIEWPLKPEEWEQFKTYSAKELLDDHL